MSVFRQIVVFGVSGAITLGNMGERSSASPVIDSQGNTSPTHLETINKQPQAKVSEEEVVESNEAVETQGVISDSDSEAVVSPGKYQGSLLEEIKSKSTQSGVNVSPISRVQINRIFKNISDSLDRNQEFKAENSVLKQPANSAQFRGGLLEDIKSKKLSNDILNSEPNLNKELSQEKVVESGEVSEAKSLANSAQSNSSLLDLLKSENNSPSEPNLNKELSQEKVVESREVSAAKSLANSAQSNSNLLHSLKSEQDINLAAENNSPSEVNLNKELSQEKVVESGEVSAAKSLANSAQSNSNLLHSLKSEQQTDLATENNSPSEPNLNKELSQEKVVESGEVSQTKSLANSAQSNSSLLNLLKSEQDINLAAENNSPSEVNLNKELSQEKVVESGEVSEAKSLANSAQTNNSSLLDLLKSENNSPSEVNLNKELSQEKVVESGEVSEAKSLANSAQTSNSSLLDSLKSEQQTDLATENNSPSEVNLNKELSQEKVVESGAVSEAKSLANSAQSNSSLLDLLKSENNSPSEPNLNKELSQEKVVESREVSEAKSLANSAQSNSSLLNLLKSEQQTDLATENNSPSEVNLNKELSQEKVVESGEVAQTKSLANSAQSNSNLLHSLKSEQQTDLATENNSPSEPNLDKELSQEKVVDKEGISTAKSLLDLAQTRISSLLDSLKSGKDTDLATENNSPSKLNLNKQLSGAKENLETNSQAKTLQNTNKSSNSLLDLLQSNQSTTSADLTLGNSNSKLESKFEIYLNKKIPQIKTTQDLYSAKNFRGLSESNSSSLALLQSNIQTQTFKQSLTQKVEKLNQSATSETKNLANANINNSNIEESPNSINQKIESKINSLLTRRTHITTSVNHAPQMATVNDLAKIETQASALTNSNNRNSHNNINQKSTIPQQVTLPGRTRQSTTETIEFPSKTKNSIVGNSAQIMTSTNSNQTTTTVPNLATTKNQTSSAIANNSTNNITIAQQTNPSRSSINTFPPPVPNGTLQTNPPSISPNSNPLYIPINPDEVQIQETIPITLQEAIDLARRNNPGIQITQLELERSRAAMREAQAALWPSLTFQSTLQRTESASGDLQSQAQRRIAEVTNRPEFQDTDIQNFPTTTFLNEFQFDYDTGVGGTRGGRIGVAREQIRLRELELERIAEQLRLDVSNDYYDLQESDGRVRIGEAAVNNARKSLEDAEALERAGVGTRFDVLQSQVTLANEQQNLTNALRDQRSSRRRLSERLSISESIDLTAADPIEPAGSWPLSLDETIVQAFQKRAELEQQLVQRDLSEQQRKLALSAVRPSLNLFATYSVLGLTTDNTSWRAARGWADGTTVGARFRWNFFDGGAARAAARQNRIDQDIAVTRFEQVQNQVRREVEEAFFALEASFENISTAELGVEQAKEALRLARLRFQAGVGTQLEVIEQETDLTRAENNLLTAIIDYNRSLSELQRAVSNLPGGDLSDLP